LERLRQVNAHPADYGCGWYSHYEFLAEHFGWKKMSREKLAIYHELTRSIPLEAVSADILDAISFNQEELDNYWYAYNFVDYPLGFIVMYAEEGHGNNETTKRLNLWREYYQKNPEELEESINEWKDNHDPNFANPLSFLYEVKFSDKDVLDKELNRIRAVIASPMDFTSDEQFYLVYECLAEHYGWKKMPTEKLIIYEELNRFIPLELADPDILKLIPFDKEEFDNYHEASKFFHYPMNTLLEDAEDTENHDRLILWREFFVKHPEEFVKVLKQEEDFSRKSPKYQPRLKDWFKMK
jgi:uncharacterized tellurite resistance protein B-like protein